MRRLVVTQNMTLDGVIDASRSWFNPVEETQQNAELAAVTAMHAAASDGFLVGRVTFEQMRSFWPQRTDDRTGVTNHLNRVAKYVVSTTLDDPRWEGTTVLRGREHLTREIRSLTAQPGTDIVATGSIQLVHDLLRSSLVDELRLFVYPIVLGAGRRLFPDRWEAPTLELVEERRFTGGVVLLRYLLPRS